MLRIAIFFRKKHFIYVRIFLIYNGNLLIHTCQKNEGVAGYISDAAFVISSRKQVLS